MKQLKLSMHPLSYVLLMMCTHWRGARTDAQIEKRSEAFGCIALERAPKIAGPPPSQCTWPQYPTRLKAAGQSTPSASELYLRSFMLVRQRLGAESVPLQTIPPTFCPRTLVWFVAGLGADGGGGETPRGAALSLAPVA